MDIEKQCEHPSFRISATYGMFHANEEESGQFRFLFCRSITCREERKHEKQRSVSESIFWSIRAIFDCVESNP